MNDPKCAIHTIASTLVVVGCLSLIGWAPPAHAQQPLTLRRAVTLALEKSPQLTFSVAKEAVMDRQAAQAHAPFSPNFFASSGAAYTSGFPMTPGGAPPSIFSLSYVQTLFNPSLRGEARAAKRRLQIGRLGVERTRNEVIVRTALLYLDLDRVKASLAVERRAGESAHRIEEITSARVAEGRELPGELLRAQISAARQDQTIVQLEGREELLGAEFRSLTGLPSDQPIELANDTLPMPPVQSTEDLISLALANDPALKQADYERQARADRLAGERGRFWPTINLVGQYALLSRINNFDEFFAKFQPNSVNIGVQVQWAPFNRRTSTAAQLARREFELANVELQQKREDLKLAVRRKVQQSRELESARRVALLELKLAQENLRTLQERFAEGKTYLRDVENARLEESHKWVAFLRADYESQQVHLELLNKTGQIGRVFPGMGADTVGEQSER